MLDRLKERPEPKLLVLNKVDLVRKEKLLTLATQFGERAKFEDIFMISATTGDGVADLKRALAARVPEGPWHFPEDQVSDASDRMLAAEVTREQLYLQLHAELPYASAIETEKYEERKDGSVAIHQQILVAATARRRSCSARAAPASAPSARPPARSCRELLGRKVHLFLHVKVNPKWEEDRGLYREIGLDWVE
jgi:GTP-binding protein Era